MQEKEVWKPVAGWEEVYEVSTHGRIRRITGNCGTHAGKFLNPRKNMHGYMIVTLSDEGGNRRKLSRTVHIIMLETFIGPAYGRRSEHFDGDRTNNILSNMGWRGESKREASASKLDPFSRIYKDIKVVFRPSEDYYKLTEEQKKAIVASHKAGLLKQAIANLYGLELNDIEIIIRGDRK